MAHGECTDAIVYTMDALDGSCVAWVQTRIEDESGKARWSTQSTTADQVHSAIGRVCAIGGDPDSYFVHVGTPKVQTAAADLSPYTEEDIDAFVDEGGFTPEDFGLDDHLGD